MTRVMPHDHLRLACRAEGHLHLACPTRYILHEEKLAVGPGRT